MSARSNSEKRTNGNGVSSSTVSARFNQAGAPILINSPITKTAIRTRKTEFAVPLRTNHGSSVEFPRLHFLYECLNYHEETVGMHLL